MKGTSACDALNYAADLTAIVVSAPEAAFRRRSDQGNVDAADNAMKRPNSSMQLTRAADYAVRVMIHLATLPLGTRVSRDTLALATEISSVVSNK